MVRLVVRVLGWRQVLWYAPWISFSDGGKYLADAQGVDALGRRGEVVQRGHVGEGAVGATWGSVSREGRRGREGCGGAGHHGRGRHHRARRAENSIRQPGWWRLP